MTSPCDPRQHCGPGPCLVTSPDGTTQYGVWYTSTGSTNKGYGAGVTVGSLNRSTGVWTTHALTGSEYTALNLPVLNADAVTHQQASTGTWGDTDSTAHRNVSIGYDSSLNLYVWGNMHDNTNQMLKSSSSNNVSAWTAATLPQQDAHNAYPLPVQCRNGDLWFIQRDGDHFSGSANSDTSDWRILNGTTTWVAGDGTGAGSTKRKIFQGCSVPNGKGAGVTGDPSSSGDTSFNWSCYPSAPYVEPSWSLHPGRIHWWLGWRTTAAVLTWFAPAYMYSDDHGVTWKAIDGSSVTLPVDPINTTNVQLGVSSLTASPYISADQGLTAVNPTTGYPLNIIERADGSLEQVQWNGSSWSQASFIGPGGIARAGGMHAFYQKGSLWYRGTTGTHPRGQFIVRSDGVCSALQATIEPQAQNGWVVNDGTAVIHAIGNPDPVAYSLFGTVEWLMPDGDIPKVHSFGGNAKYHA